MPWLTASAHNIYLDMLSAAVQLRHPCDEAHHLASVAVTERVDEHKVWAGIIEVFELVGHPTAKLCYAWAEMTTDSERQFVAVLGSRLIHSPHEAVKAWMASKHVVVHPVFDHPSRIPAESTQGEKPYTPLEAH